ncbi:hypothetical protein DVS28_b0311 (plasmid) [Euzebya pacifica]|uniref:Mce-associated membrane protein n=1 Tax=Euzebya pacifica TaxID=1608957 RepID=A0A346Y6I4_9ACTN|nr:hypothetical protein DVS28_b0311 [Euzebya pacifica]
MELGCHAGLVGVLGQDAALAAARQVALKVTTFAGAEIDRWASEMETLSTEGYAAEIRDLFGADIRRDLAAAAVQTVGQVESIRLSEFDGSTGVAFAVVQQTYSSRGQPQSVSDILRMEIAVERVGGEWLVSDVAVLGPTTLVPDEN